MRKSRSASQPRNTQVPPQLFPRSLLDFEIVFYERLLTEKPDLFEALVALGHAYTRKGRHADGLKMDMQLTRLRPRDPVIWYNTACSFSLLEQIPQSLRALSKAIRLGYDDFEHLAKDPDLTNLRRSSTFQHFLQKVSGHKPSDPAR